MPKGNPGIAKHKKRVCINGHDTFQCGRNSTGHCTSCQTIGHKSFTDRNIQFKRIYNWKRDKMINCSGKPFNYEDYLQLFKEQAGRCANKNCRIPQSELKSSFHVDHDHKTGRVRGLLCKNCNWALGTIKDSLSKLEGLIAYLKLVDNNIEVN